MKKPGDPNAPLTGLDLYYALSEKVKAEHEKKLGEQNYTELKKKLMELAASKDGGRAARFAEYTLKQVERYELACQVGKEVDQQRKELEKTTAKIDEARTTKLGGIVDRSKFALVGKLETSSVYAGASKRFRVLDDAGKTICYVMPTGPIANTDFNKYIGHKVGLVGPDLAACGDAAIPHRVHRDCAARFRQMTRIDPARMWVVDSPEKRKSCQGWRDFFFLARREPCHPFAEAQGRL